MSKTEEIKAAYEELQNVAGKYVTDKDFMKAAYSRNVDPAFPDRWADIIARPGTVEEVSEIVKIANKYKLPITPRGGGADLVGGSATDEGILLDMTRMNKILDVDEDNFFVIVECGVTWAELLSELHPRGLTTGIIGPGSGFSATIGGGISNASACGGSTKYGLVPDITLGLEVVLPNPQGTIVKTGSWANRYAKPHCRYGVSPDFTGLFCGDVGTMGIKTKAVLRLFPYAPFVSTRSYMLKKDDYDILWKLMKKLRMKVNNSLRDCSGIPAQTLQLMAMNPAFNIPDLHATGPLLQVSLEGFDERIVEIQQERVDEIMKEDTNPLGPAAKNPKFNLTGLYHYFDAGISPVPGMLSCTTCHKIEISNLGPALQSNVDYDQKHRAELKLGEQPGMFIPGMILSLQLNGNLVIVGGFSGINDKGHQTANMEVWHGKIRNQVKYGAAHYWLGESISQSITEAGAFDLNYTQFFKDMKKAVDPNFLLSRKKFHLNSYEDKAMENYSKNPLS
ncbi:MAG: FAD-binding oxidoreductase [Promethearchaeota archaeon]